jgi:hypothetical protein
LQLQDLKNADEITAHLRSVADALGSDSSMSK